MILYDKKGNFLGMGQKELSSLGFQDFDEFKSYYNDPADMFINRPGYISKFKNFSWIDYALHSGVPNKNIIIKNTNGQELEATLQISEIFLMQELNESSGIYNVEISFSSDKNMQNHDTLFEEDNFDMRPHVAFESEEDDTLTIKEEEPAPLDIPIADTDTVPETFKIEDFNDDFIEPQTDVSIEPQHEDHDLSGLDFDDKENSFDETIKPATEEYVPNVKLKINLDSDFDEPVTPQEPEIEIPTEKFEDFLGETTSEDTTSEDTTLEETTLEEADIKEEPVIEKERIKETQPILQYDFDIDIVQIAEETDMDLEDIALFMNAFIQESKKTLHLIDSSLETLDAAAIKEMIIKLKGIVSQLKVHSIIHTLDAIIASIGDDDFSEKIEIFKIQIKDMEEKLF
ncbi:hypothetical protein [Sulfurospirillum sp. 1612]|uniref:hypothetical protein n=1 Tax=Sulfurospirillum sp. 1612 TaxID=3094835 RepID=UPI002F9372B3